MSKKEDTPFYFFFNKQAVNFNRAVGLSRHECGRSMFEQFKRQPCSSDNNRGLPN